MPGGDAGCDAWMSSPSHFGSLLVESAMRDGLILTFPCAAEMVQQKLKVSQEVL